MRPTTDLLRAELERLFELDEMIRMARELLALEPDDVGGTGGKGAFARALAERCRDDDALFALADAITFSGKTLSQTLAATLEDFPLGAEIGPYRLVRKLGEGGTGITYAADPIEGGPPVALKVLRAEHAAVRSAVQRWLTASRAIGRVQAPGLGKVLGADELGDGRAWVATELADGPSLAARLARSGPMHIGELRGIARDVLTALDALHTRGIAHGGLKSENIFLARSAASADPTLPIAMLVDAAGDRLWARAPRVGAFTSAHFGVLGIAGTPKCFAPERARQGRATPSSDVYELGCVLYEALTGRPVFEGESGIDVIAAHMLSEPTPPSVLAPRGWVLRALDDLILRALAKSPEDRFRSARHMRDAIEALARASIGPVAQKREDLDLPAFERLRRAFLAAPSDLELAGQIEQLTEASHEGARAAEVFLEAAQSVADVEEKKSLLFRAARMHETGEPRFEAAESIYRSILEIDPDDDIARAAIEESKRRAGDAEGLVELLLVKVEREDVAEIRAQILREIAELYERDLDDSDNAFVAWVQAISDDPRDEHTRQQIERLAGENVERWNEALTTLSEAVRDTSHRPTQIALYVLLGRWYAARLGRPDFAMPCYAQALALDPSCDPALEGAIDLYRKAQSWQELVVGLVRRAEVTNSHTLARDCLAEAAEIVHRKLNDPARAIDLFERVLLSDPAHGRATDALAALYGERKDWGAMLAMLERKADNEHGAARLETLASIAELYEDRLSERDEALAAYERALAIDARHVPSLKGQERLLSQAGRFAELLVNLQAQLSVLATPRQRISILERIGAIQEEEFVDRAAAAETYDQIVALEPSHEAAHAALQRLYRQLRRFDDLAAALERHASSTEDVSRRIALLLSAARVLAVDVGAPERASTIVESVLAIEPKHSEALDLHARLRAQAGDSQAALDAMDRLADSEADPLRRAELLVRAGAAWQEAGNRDRAIERFKEALDVHPTNAGAAAALRAIYAARGDAHGAAEALLREIAMVEGPAKQARLYAELGTLRRDRLKDKPAAREAFQRAIELDATCTPAAAGLGDLAFEAHDHASAARYYEPLLARANELGKEGARSAALRCGDSFRALGLHDKAARAYEAAAATGIDGRDLRERLALSAFDRGDFAAAVRLGRELLARHGDELVGADRGEALYRLGESLRRTGKTDEARALLEEAAALAPAHGALDALKQLYGERGDWESVANVLRRRADVAKGDERVAALLELGDVLLGKVGDRERASRAFASALETRPDDRKLLTKLMAVYSEARDWNNLVDVVLRIAQLVDDPAQLGKYYNTVATITHHELNRPDEAVSYYEKALEHSPELTKPWDNLVGLLQVSGDWPRLELAYRTRLRQLSELPEAKRPSPSELAALWDALGEILRHRLGRSSEAVEAYEKALALDSGERRRLEQLAAVYTKEPKRYFAKALTAHQQLLAINPYRMESYQALRKLYTEAKKPDESWCVCQTLTVLKSAHADEEAFFRKHRSRKPAPATDPMSEESFTRLVAHPDLDLLLTDIFSAMLPAALSARGQPPSAFGLEGARPRDTVTDPADLARTLHYASMLTQIPLPPVYYRDQDPGGLSFVFTSPPAIGLGQSGRSGVPPQALAFIAGRHLTFHRGGLFLRQLVPTGSALRGWLLAAIRSVQPQFPIPPDLVVPVKEGLTTMKKAMSGRDLDALRSLVQRLLSAAPELDLRRWTAAVDLTADRVGFILANDLEIASAVVRASPEESSSVPQKDRLRELHLYSVSEQYLQLRHKLGIAIGD